MESHVNRERRWEGACQEGCGRDLCLRQAGGIEFVKSDPNCRKRVRLSAVKLVWEIVLEQLTDRV